MPFTFETSWLLVLKPTLATGCNVGVRRNLSSPRSALCPKSLSHHFTTRERFTQSRNIQEPFKFGFRVTCIRAVTKRLGKPSFIPMTGSVHQNRFQVCRFVPHPTPLASFQEQKSPSDMID